MILQTRNLNKSFNSIVAIRDLDFEMEEGAVECIIGPNGAGKTTFINLLTGALQPDKGEILFNGSDITGSSLHEIAREGIVRKYQTPKIYINLTVRKNLSIAGNVKDTSTSDNRIEDVLSQIRLVNYQDQKAGTLDHGRKQWLEMGMVLVTEPQLMLLDEPTAGMTNEETKETASLIESMNTSGLSIIVIEHDMDFIRKLDSRISVLHKGEILAQGDIDTIENNDRVQEVYIGGEA
jgi:urea ABC transporter ATP-binding protein UrtD